MLPILEANHLPVILEVNHLPENDARRGESLFELGKALRGEGKKRDAAEALKKSAAIYNAGALTGG